MALCSNPGHEADLVKKKRYKKEKEKKTFMQNIVIPKDLEPVRTRKDLGTPIVWYRVYMTRDHEFVTYPESSVQGTFISKTDQKDLEEKCLLIKNLAPAPGICIVELVPLPGVVGYNASYLEHIKTIFQPQFIFTSRSIVFLHQFKKMIPEAICMPFLREVTPTESFFAKAKKGIINHIKHLSTWNMNGFLVFENEE